MMMTSLLIFLAVTCPLCFKRCWWRLWRTNPEWCIVYADDISRFCHLSPALFKHFRYSRARSFSTDKKKNIHSIPYSIFSSIPWNFSLAHTQNVRSLFFAPIPYFSPPLIAGTSPLENECFFVEGAKPLLSPLLSLVSKTTSHFMVLRVVYARLVILLLRVYLLFDLKGCF